MIICPVPRPSDALVCGGNSSVDEFCPSPTAIARYYTEIILNGNLVIPPQKPPKDRMVKVNHSVNITDVETILVTPPTAVPGYKIVVSGVITIGIQYIAEGPEQKVHFAHFDLPFNAIIVDDCGGLIPLEPTAFVPHVCVEKIRLTQLDPRTISKEVVLMVWIELL